MSGSRRRWFRYTLGVVAILVLLALWLRPAGIRLRAAEASPVASPLRLVSLEGQQFELSSLRGQVVLLNLWAGWCPPCRTEIRVLRTLDERYAQHGLVVLGVNVEDLDGAAVARLGQELGITYRTALPGGPFEGTFQTRGVIPQTWLIDRAGRVRASRTGLVSASSLDRACRRLLDEPAVVSALASDDGSASAGRRSRETG